MGVKILLYIFLVAVGDGQILVAKDDAEALNGLCLRHVDNVRAVGTQEFGTGQVVLHLLHIHQTHNLLSVGQIDTDIVLQTFNVEDVVQGYTHQLVVALHIHKAVSSVGLLLLGDAEPVECLVRGLQEVLIAHRLHQIVQRRHLVTLDSILLEGGGEDDLRLLGQNLGKLNTREFGHLYVKE